MARNSDRRCSGLNRFLEAKGTKEADKKRPSLYHLTTAEEVKKWIPSIKREIEYLLQQISGSHASRNYSSSKIEEFKLRVDQLKKEHSQFVSKVRTLDPSYEDVTPWELRGYRRKRSLENKKLCLGALQAEITAELESTDIRTTPSDHVCKSKIELEGSCNKLVKSHDHVEKKKTSDELNDVPANLNVVPTTSHIISASNSSITSSVCSKEATTSTGLSTIPSSNLLHLDYSSSETSSEDESHQKRQKCST